MITISVTSLGVIAIKTIVFVFVSFFLAMFFLWPINDRPTSATQVFLWAISEAILAGLMSSAIQFTW